MPVTDETRDFLEQAKKGKTRKFVLIVKGASIVNLVVYKKGGTSKSVKRAKEEGKGIPCFGTVTGKGMELGFQLAIDDGFDKAPVKDLVLKKYLEDEADFKCKPEFVIVQSRPIALDGDDPLHARFIALQPIASQACDDFPDEVASISDLCKKIGGLLDEEEREAASEQLGALERLLASLKPTTAAPPKTTADPLQTVYNSLRQKLEPLLLAAQRAAPDKATAFSNVWNYAEAQANNAIFAVANKALAALAESIKAVLATPASANKDTSESGGKESFVMLQKARLLWDSTRKAILSELQGLESAIVVACKDEPDIDKIVAGSKNLYDMLEKLDTRLIDKLDEALNASMAEKRTALQSEAYDLVSEYREFVDSDPLVRDVDRNGFVKTSIRGRLTKTLDNLATELVP